NPLRAEGKKRQNAEGVHNLRPNTSQGGATGVSSAWSGGDARRSTTRAAIRAACTDGGGTNWSPTMRVRLAGGMMRGRFSGLAKKKNTCSSGKGAHCSNCARLINAMAESLERTVVLLLKARSADAIENQVAHADIRNALPRSRWNMNDVSGSHIGSG